MEFKKVKKGDKFVTLNDFEIYGCSLWRMPYVGGFDCVIPKGTVLVAHSDQLPDALGFSLKPEKYDEMKEVLVPENDRTDPKFGGYYFVFTNDQIGKDIDYL